MSHMPDAIIDKLRLQPLPVEGGLFHETYRSSRRLPDGQHSCGASIYYLLRRHDRSDWHRLASDEIWFYHAGAPAVQLLLFPDGPWTERVIGPEVQAGQVPQSVIPAGVWQAATLLADSPTAWGLFGAALFPSFEYADFTAGNGRELAAAYPAAAARIRALNLE